MRTSTQIREEIESIAAAPRYLRSRRLALLAELERRENQLRCAILVDGHAQPDHVGNNGNYVWTSCVQIPQTIEISQARLVLEMMEDSTEYKEVVVPILDPLFIELSEAEAAEQAARDAISMATIAAKEAREQAEAKALESVSKDKTLTAAQAKLDALKQEHAHLLPPEPEPEPPTAQESYHAAPVKRLGKVMEEPADTAVS